MRDFWLKELTGEERGAVRGFLAKEDYDVREEELMYNEMQAYLMFTRDPTFFTPDMVGMTAGDGWPNCRPASSPACRRDGCANVLARLGDAVVGPLTARPVYGRASRVSAAPARRAPRCRSVSIAACRSRR